MVLNEIKLSKEMKSAVDAIADKFKKVNLWVASVPQSQRAWGELQKRGRASLADVNAMRAALRLPSLSHNRPEVPPITRPAEMVMISFFNENGNNIAPPKGYAEFVADLKGVIWGGEDFPEVLYIQARKKAKAK